MGIDMTAITDLELLHELYRRFDGRCYVWVDEDVAYKLEEWGYETTKENIDAVWSHMGRYWLVDRMTEVGYHAIDDAISYAEKDLTKTEEV